MFMRVSKGKLQKLQKIFKVILGLFCGFEYGLNKGM